MFWSVIGLSAAILTTFSFVPQIFKILRTKSAKDISIFTICQFSLGVSLWIAYGVHLKDAIIIGANVVSLFTVLTMLVLYLKYNL